MKEFACFSIAVYTCLTFNCQQQKIHTETPALNSSIVDYKGM